ncbi:MAG: tripartite tricarboxylate transporter substrate binding protein [Ideonella sp.]
MNRRSIIQLLALAAAPRLALAQAWPAKPLRWVVPFPPGGTTDVVTRLVAAEISRSLQQAIAVDNKPGAGTVIGVDLVAKAPPDGLTLLTVANSFCVNQTLVKKLPYDGLRDFKPVALMGLSEHVLAARTGLGVKTLADLKALALRRPGELSYASFGIGTSAHLSGEMLKTALGIDLIHVPYKGQAPALANLLGGQVDLMFGNWPEFRTHVRAGKLIAVGMATHARSIYAPEVPTLAEQGLPLESNSWNGLLVRSGTPDAVVQRLSAEVQKALKSPTVAQAFAEGGIAAQPGTPEQFSAFIASEIDKYAVIIRKAGITADN